MRSKFQKGQGGKTPMQQFLKAVEELPSYDLSVDRFISSIGIEDEIKCIHITDTAHELSIEVEYNDSEVVSSFQKFK